MRELLVKAWLRPLIVGLSLWLGFFGGSWATMRWLANRIQDRIETVAGLDRDIEDVRRTLSQLEVDTWGLVFHEIKGERFVVVPDGALADPAWWVDDRPALKLSNECSMETSSTPSWMAPAWSVVWLARGRNAKDSPTAPGRLAARLAGGRA